MFETILDSKLKRIKGNLLDFSNETSNRINKSIKSFLNEDIHLAIDIQLLKRSIKNFVSLYDFYNQMFAELGEKLSSSSSMHSVFIEINLWSRGHRRGVDDRITYSIIGKRVTHHKVFCNVLMR